MNYRQIYVALICKAKERADSGLDPNQKYELHHYFPVCLWRDRSQNTKVVSLTLREHWIAHKLLFKMFPCQGTATALLLMGKRTPKMNSRKFEALRLALHEYNWTKTREGRIYLSEQMKRRWDEGEWNQEEIRKKWSEGSKRNQAKWKLNGNHPLSSSSARKASSERAKKRNSVSSPCNKCGAVIGGGTGNMTQHQQGSKCKLNTES